MTVERRMMMGAAGGSTTSAWTTPTADISGSECCGVITSPVDGSFVAIGRNASNKACYTYSSNGVSFSSVAELNSSVTTDGTGLAGVCTPSGKWFVVGNSGTSPVSEAVWTSTDGVNWTTPTLTTVGGHNLFGRGVAYDGSGKLIKIIQDYDGTNNTGWWSSSTDNGSTWSAYTRFNGYTGSWAPNQIIYANGRWMVCGASGNNGGAFWFTTSTDGSTWTTPAAITTNIDCAYSWCVAGRYDGVFVASGYVYTFLFLKAAEWSRSTDGLTWSAASLYNGAINTGASWGNGIFDAAATGSNPINVSPVTGSFVTVSISRVTPTTPIYSVSTDGGVTWTPFASIFTPASNWIPRGAAININGRMVVYSQLWSYTSKSGF